MKAIYYHKISTDDNPQHQYCPTPKNTWCWWQARQEADDPEIEAALIHDPTQDPKVAEKTFANLRRFIRSNTTNNTNTQDKKKEFLG